MKIEDYLERINELNNELRNWFYNNVRYYSQADEANFNLPLAEIYSLSSKLCSAYKEQSKRIGRLQAEIKELKDSYGESCGKKMLEVFADRIRYDVEQLEEEFRQEYFKR